MYFNTQASNFISFISLALECKIKWIKQSNLLTAITLRCTVKGSNHCAEFVNKVYELNNVCYGGTHLQNANAILPVIQRLANIKHALARKG